MVEEHKKKGGRRANSGRKQLSDKDKRIKTYIKTIKILNIFFAHLFDKEYFQ